MKEYEASDILSKLTFSIVKKKSLDTDTKNLILSAVGEGIKALEKQIPKKPKQSGVTDNNGVFHPINGIDGVPYELCPNCETNLCTTGLFGKKNRSNYCSNCGQRLSCGTGDEEERTGE